MYFEILPEQVIAIFNTMNFHSPYTLEELTSTFLPFAFLQQADLKIPVTILAISIIALFLLLRLSKVFRKPSPSIYLSLIISFCFLSTLLFLHEHYPFSFKDNYTYLLKQDNAIPVDKNLTITQANSNIEIVKSKLIELGNSPLQRNAIYFCVSENETFEKIIQCTNDMKLPK